MDKRRKAGVKLLLDEYPLIVQPTLATLVGLHEAILLQQIHYWLTTPGVGEEHEGRRWVYNSARKWSQQMPFMSEDQLARSIGNLRKSGLLLTGNYNKAAYDRTLWYSIDYNKLDLLTAECIPQNCGMDSAELRNGFRASAEPIPETTRDYTETTVATSSLRSDVDDLPFGESQEKPTRKRRVKAGLAALYHWEKTHCRIMDAQIEALNEAVQTPEQLASWQKVVDTWLLRGYSPKNVEGPLNWFREGVPIQGGTAYGKPKKPMDRADMEYLRVNQIGGGAPAVKETVKGWERPADLI